MVGVGSVHSSVCRDVKGDGLCNGVGEVLEVYPDGSIFWSRQSHFVLSCKTSDTLDRMPFDTQVRPESETACRARSTPHG